MSLYEQNKLIKCSNRYTTMVLDKMVHRDAPLVVVVVDNKDLVVVDDNGVVELMVVVEHVSVEHEVPLDMVELDYWVAVVGNV